VLSRLLRKRPSLPDAVLEGSMAAAIEAAKLRHAVGDDGVWQPGERLKLLLVGYMGTRNTGADVRVNEMIRQLRTIFSDEQLELTACTSDARLSAGYFPGVRQVKLPDVYPPFLLRETAKHHGVVACEGSMFKSKFANALTTLMAGALGLAASQNKVAVGYGAEAGAMDPLLKAFVARYCQDALVIVRNEPSRDVLGELGVPTSPGTDTAWTFEPAGPQGAEAMLRRAGWDGVAPVLVVCPINPFWWPVRPRLGQRLLDRLSGGEADTHYRSIYYHDYGGRDRERYDAYLDALAEGAGGFARERGAFLVLCGMERLDRRACDHLAERLGPVPRFISDEWDMFELVALLRRASWLVTSRYHAMACSMPGGVPSVGVTMDERIRNLLDMRGQPELCCEVDDVDLAERVRDALERLDPEATAAACRGTVARELVTMGEMGIAFEDEVLRRYPDLPRRDVPRTWEHYLPPLSPALEALLGDS
jgi:polysaccharide pyruvyl transferase WcaK-like protein